MQIFPVMVTPFRFLLKIKKTMKFTELELNNQLLDAIKEIGFSDMTPIQEKAIPEGLKGKDITGLAQTGTGKTISFLVTIIQKILT